MVDKQIVYSKKVYIGDFIEPMHEDTNLEEVNALILKKDIHMKNIH